MADEQPRAVRNRFYYASACAIAALIVLSFPQTYFLPVATGEKSFGLLRHLHGLAFFAFTALLVWQAWLIQRRKVAAHREWGTFGTALAGMMFVLGLWMAVAAIEERRANSVGLPFEFAIYNLVDITLFSTFLGWSIREAFHRIDWHRNLVFIAALNLLGPAGSRWVLQAPLPYPWLDMAPSILADLGLIVLAWHDRRTRGSVHPATIVAALVMVPVHIAAPFVARSAWWNALAPHLFGFA